MLNASLSTSSSVSLYSWASFCLPDESGSDSDAEGSEEGGSTGSSFSSLSDLVSADLLAPNPCPIGGGGGDTTPGPVPPLRTHHPIMDLSGILKPQTELQFPSESGVGGGPKSSSSGGSEGPQGDSAAGGSTGGDHVTRRLPRRTQSGRWVKARWGKRWR